MDLRIREDDRSDSGCGTIHFNSGLKIAFLDNNDSNQYHRGQASLPKGRLISGGASGHVISHVIRTARYSVRYMIGQVSLHLFVHSNSTSQGRTPKGYRGPIDNGSPHSLSMVTLILMRYSQIYQDVINDQDVAICITEMTGLFMCELLGAIPL